ncbi:hypothetical protein [Liquorilactobacillus capillatus]|uniref:Uncharacterized protein n=1 Tax=Liquorilactobacillus capillatus DSM 19910 TaxID=1423731 RepID=A0A0R1M272_9LACO|nr:hypothetical protein [Liquorilactobacillus capillatus]KRL02166.1 hypothetical protein FC81_GL000929 [Liquorilactobacillus capillatus DSM 19910]
MEKIKTKLQLAFALLSIFFIPLLIATIWAISTANKWIILGILLLDFFYLTIESTFFFVLLFNRFKKKPAEKSNESK